MGDSGRKPKKVQVRCSEETFVKWQRIQAELAPFGDQEDALQKLLSTYERNPGMFNRETV